MKFINKNTPYKKRREIIIVDNDDLPKGIINTKKASAYLFGGIYKIGYDLYKGKNFEEQIKDLVRDEFKFPCLPIQSIDSFEFNTIPQKKQLFTALKELPNFYFNLINIQEQILKCKMDAFIDFCTSLGVKEARIVSDKSDKSQRGANIDMPIDETTQVGLNYNNNKESKSLIQKSFSFPKPKYQLHECTNQFYKLEPDWVKIQALRLDSLKDIIKAEIQIKKQHDFNLSVDFKAIAAEQNINLGFKSENTSNEVYIYELEFWEKE